MLEFNVTSIQTKAAHGKLISGVLKNGTLRKGATIFLHDEEGKFIRKGTIFTIFNKSRSRVSFDSTETARNLKITLKESEINVLPEHRILDRELPAIQKGNIGAADFVDLTGFHFGGIQNVILDTVIPSPIHFDTILSQTHSWRSKQYSELGLSLQGGGVKGAFGVGALKFLQVAGILDGKKKLHLASASTGSLTSVLLAENSPESIDKAIAQYSELNKLEEMFTIRTKVKIILNNEPTLKAIVLSAFKKGGSPDVEIDLKDFLVEKFTKVAKETLYDTLTNPLSLFAVLPVVGVSFISNVAEEIESVKKNLNTLTNVKLSLATLEPVLGKLMDNSKGINGAKLRKSIRTKKVTLKMAVTCLESGATCYITEKLELLYPKKGVIGDGYSYSPEDFHIYTISSIGGENINGETSATILKTGLAMGAITSGAFPALFEPQKIKYITPDGEKEELFNDGGIRENLPINILKREKVKNILAIYCSSFEEKIEETDTVNNYSWGDVAMRTVSLIDSENARNDISSGKPMNTNLKGEGDHNVLHIAPTTGTLGLTEVHPFNIKTTIWYGYLRAYDEIFLSDFKETLGTAYQTTKIALRENTEDIFVCFRALGMIASKVVGSSGYRVPIKKGHSHKKYVRWGRSRKVDQYFGIRGLNNNDIIHFVALDFDAAYSYLKLKNELLALLNTRYKLIKIDPNYPSGFMHGPSGFMKKALFTDWFGVYEHLNLVRIASNKRTRLTQKFRSISLLNANSNPLYVHSLKVYGYPDQEAPRRITQRSHPRFKQLIRTIISNINDLERNNVLFEGSYSDKLIPDLFLTLSNDNEMDSKDNTYFA